MSEAPAHQSRNSSTRPISGNLHLRFERRPLFDFFDLREAYLLALYALFVKMRPMEKWTGITDWLYPIEHIERSDFFRRFRHLTAFRL